MSSLSSSVGGSASFTTPSTNTSTVSSRHRASLHRLPPVHRLLLAMQVSLVVLDLLLFLKHLRAYHRLRSQQQANHGQRSATR